MQPIRQDWTKYLQSVGFDELTEDQQTAAEIAEAWLLNLPDEVRADGGLLLQYAAAAAVIIHLRRNNRAWRFFSTRWRGWHDLCGIDGILAHRDEHGDHTCYAVDFSAGGVLEKRSGPWFVRLKHEWFARVHDVSSQVFVVKPECFRELVQSFRTALSAEPCQICVPSELWDSDADEV